MPPHFRWAIKKQTVSGLFFIAHNAYIRQKKKNHSVHGSSDSAHGQVPLYSPGKVREKLRAGEVKVRCGDKVDESEDQGGVNGGGPFFSSRGIEAKGAFSEGVKLQEVAETVGDDEKAA